MRMQRIGIAASVHNHDGDFNNLKFIALNVAFARRRNLRDGVVAAVNDEVAVGIGMFHRVVLVVVRRKGHDAVRPVIGDDVRARPVTGCGHLRDRYHARSRKHHQFESIASDGVGVGAAVGGASAVVGDTTEVEGTDRVRVCRGDVVGLTVVADGILLVGVKVSRVAHLPVARHLVVAAGGRLRRSDGRHLAVETDGGVAAVDGTGGEPRVHVHEHALADLAAVAAFGVCREGVGGLRSIEDGIVGGGIHVMIRNVEPLELRIGGVFGFGAELHLRSEAHIELFGLVRRVVRRNRRDGQLQFLRDDEVGGVGRPVAAIIGDRHHHLHRLLLVFMLRIGIVREGGLGNGVVTSVNRKVAVGVIVGHRHGVHFRRGYKVDMPVAVIRNLIGTRPVAVIEGSFDGIHRHRTRGGEYHEGVHSVCDRVAVCTAFERAGLVVGNTHEAIGADTVLVSLRVIGQASIIACSGSIGHFIAGHGDEVPLVGFVAVTANGRLCGGNRGGSAVAAKTDRVKACVNAARTKRVVLAHHGIRTARTLRGAVGHRHRVGAGGSDRGLVGILGQLGGTGAPCIGGTRQIRSCQRGLDTAADGGRDRVDGDCGHVVHRHRRAGVRGAVGLFVGHNKIDMLRARGGPIGLELASGSVTIHRTVLVVAQRPLVGVVAFNVVRRVRHGFLQCQHRVAQRRVDTDTVVVANHRLQGVIYREGVAAFGEDILLLTADVVRFVILVGVAREDVRTNRLGVGFRRRVRGRGGFLNGRIRLSIVCTYIPYIMYIVGVGTASGRTGAHNLGGVAATTDFTAARDTIVYLTRIKCIIDVHLYRLADLAAVIVFGPHRERSGSRRRVSDGVITWGVCIARGDGRPFILCSRCILRLCRKGHLRAIAHVERIVLVRRVVRRNRKPKLLRNNEVGGVSRPVAAGVGHPDNHLHRLLSVLQLQIVGARGRGLRNRVGLTSACEAAARNGHCIPRRPY